MRIKNIFAAALVAMASSAFAAMNPKCINLELQPCLAGRSGGQTQIGGTATGNNYILQSNTSRDGAIILGNDTTQPEKVVVHGTETTFTAAGATAPVVFRVQNEGITSNTMVIDKYTSTAGSGATISFARGGGTTASKTVVANSYLLASLNAFGYDGTDFERAASIQMFVDDASPSGTSMGGLISFQTTATSAGSGAAPTERLKINSSGRVFVTGSGFSVNGIDFTWPSSVVTGSLITTSAGAISSINGAASDVLAMSSTGTTPVYRTLVGVDGITVDGSSPTTIDLVGPNINSLSAMSVPDAIPDTGDLFAVTDVSVGTNYASQRKITIDNLALGINQLTDPLSQYVRRLGRATTTNDITISTSGTGTIVGSDDPSGSLVLGSTSDVVRGLITVRDKLDLRTGDSELPSDSAPGGMINYVPGVTVSINGGTAIFRLIHSAPIVSLTDNVLGNLFFAGGTWSANTSVTGSAMSWYVASGTFTNTTATSNTPIPTVNAFNDVDIMQSLDNDVGTVTALRTLNSAPIVKTITTSDAAIRVTDLTTIRSAPSITTSTSGQTSAVTNRKIIDAQNVTRSGGGLEVLNNNVIIDVAAQTSDGLNAVIRSAVVKTPTTTTSTSTTSAGSTTTAASTTTSTSTTLQNWLIQSTGDADSAIAGGVMLGSGTVIPEGSGFLSLTAVASGTCGANEYWIQGDTTPTPDVLRMCSNGNLITMPGAADTLVGLATADVLTNKTLDVEATGNVVTTVSKYWFPTAQCNGITASFNFDTPVTNAPGAACQAGTNTQKAVANFNDTTDNFLQTTLRLPSDWTGNIDVSFKWLAVATSGTVGWCAQFVCVADAETDDPAYPAQSSSNCVSDTAKGTASQTNDASITSVPTSTGTCAAGELMHIQISRDANGGAVTDSMTGDASLIGVELTLRRAQ